MTINASRPAARSSVRDRLVRIAELTTTPLLPSDYLDLVAPLRSGAPLRGRIVTIHPETRDAVTLVIKPGRDWKGHLPGQYVRVGVDVDGVRQWRTYSLTSLAGAPDGNISVTVKAIPDGIVSNYLVRRATTGTVIQIDQAAGDFTLGSELPQKTLFITAGSGITPVMGMLRNHAHQLRDTVVVHSAPTAEDVIFAGELRTLARRGIITLIERHTDTDGMLSMDDLGELVTDLDERETWACGPAGLLDALERTWAERGIAERLHTERFRLAPLVTGDGGTVTFTKSGTVLQSDGTQTLLDAGESAGVLMPSGCRMGVCFGCVAPLRQGVVRDVRSGDITTAAEGDGVLIQTCISAAAGSCDIDL
ncbi:FAD-binding oxidoreductase [Hoyosella sp. YIM 151337]|uniref:ferredoxin reductase n=1 Tax=Hoyosella sp. YIM 151337 TaxID=2992742 RepID=UPI0022367DA8|nr:ferredoxin reductase [Hoyosella sp. YIM 151337]MCW4351758.1 FAD-binding oxidoreductase [Hoyosella sp. YIM 151337]